MTETSYYWSDASVGDGALSPYSDGEYSTIWRKLFMQNRATMGVLRNYANQLSVTNPSGNTIRVKSGAALVDGKFYESDADVDNTITTPTTATRKDRVVLRKSWAAQNVRVAILTGVEGGGTPSLTQTEGVTWEIPLSVITITTGGSITTGDERTFLVSPMNADLSANAWVEIERKTLAGTETTILFDNIPATYSALVVIGQLRHLRGTSTTDLAMIINGDASAVYNNQFMRGANATASAGGTASDTYAILNTIPANTGTLNHFSYLKLTLPQYANTDFYKTWFCEEGSIPNNTAADFDIGAEHGMWRSTNAIYRIAFYSPAASGTAFNSACKIVLYGVV